MLQSDERAKIEQYINQTSDIIYNEAKKCIKNGISNQQVIDKVINITINRFAPVSKSVMYSAYNTMTEHTLAKQIFQNSQNKAVFYEKDILKDLNSKFLFDVPKHINYEESRIEINKWIASGAVVVVGGIISVPTKSIIPVGIAVMIAGVMLFVLNNKKSRGEQDIYKLVHEYLQEVTKTMMEWLNTIETYYDERVEELERELVK